MIEYPIEDFTLRHCFWNEQGEEKRPKRMLNNQPQFLP